MVWTASARYNLSYPPTRGVVEAPLNGTGDLGDVAAGSRAQGVDDGAEGCEGIRGTQR